MTKALKKKLTSHQIWLRVFFMLLYISIFYLTQSIIISVTIFQLGSVLLTGKPNKRLLYFGQNLSIYISQILNYLSYNSDEKPYPLNSWPNNVVGQKQPILKLKPESKTPYKH
jgi:hypothetical protein